MRKLYRKNFTVLLSSLALSSSLFACTPAKNNQNSEYETANLIIKNAIDQENNYIEKAEDTFQVVQEKNKDKEIEEYITLLKQQISELGSIAKEKWNSEETQEKLVMIRQKSKDLFDFVFNGKEINGIKFKDLSDNGKKIVQNGLEELDYYTELMIPNYQERLHELIVNKGVDLLETYDSVKQWYDQYKVEITEEYNKTKIKK